QLLPLAVARDHQLDAISGIPAHDCFDQLLRVCNVPPIDPDDDVARSHAGLVGGAAGSHSENPNAVGRAVGGKGNSQSARRPTVGVAAVAIPAAGIAATVILPPAIRAGSLAV